MAHTRVSHRFTFFVVVVVAVLVLLYGILAAFGVGRVVSASLDARDAMDQAEQAVEQLKFEEAQGALTQAKEDIRRAQQGLLVLRPFVVLPWVGDQVQGVQDILDASARLIPALTQVIDIASEIVRVIHTAEQLTDLPLEDDWTYLSLPDAVRRDVLIKLHQSVPDMEVVRSRIVLAERDLAQLDALQLATPLQEAIGPFRVLLPDVRQTIDLLIPLADVLPAFTGLDVPQSFLVLFQNNAELRPAGGFIGTFGTLTMRDGAIRTLTSQDSYSIDRLAEGKLVTTPPAAIKRYLGVDAWYFRDANWSPDFAIAANTAEQLLTKEQLVIGVTPTNYAGVIALTPTFAAELLRVLGPVTIGDQTFTADNIFDTLEYQVEHGFKVDGLPESQRKDVIGTLMAEVVHRLSVLPFRSWSQVVDVATVALQEKQVLLYSHDPETQATLTKAGWSGTLTPPASDALLFVDSNLGSLKSDPAVQRTIRYRVRQQESGGLIASAAIEYRHTGTFDWKTTRYQTYTRLYVPEGSQLIRVTGAKSAADQGSELGFTTFGTYIVIEPGETKTVIVDYYLPDTVAQQVASGSYDLTVFKQAGAANYALTVDVDFGKPLTSARPSEDPSEFGNTQYLLNTQLDQDREVSVSY